MSAEAWLPWVNRAFYVAGAVGFLTSFLQIQLNDRISDHKDKALQASQAQAAKEQGIAALKIKEADIRLAELQERVQWRSFNKTQVSLLSVELRKQKGNVHLGWIHGDLESRSFSESIAKVFIECGWTTTNMAVSPMGEPFFGLSIQNDYNGPQAPFMREAFDKAGIHYRTDRPQASGTSGPLPKPGDVRILVGSKPPFELSHPDTNPPEP